MANLIQTVWPLDDVPTVCKRFEERRMERGSSDHEYVEIVGGPLDGRRLKETGEKFSHSTAVHYTLPDYSGKKHVYRPMRVTKLGGSNVLKLEYVGPWEPKKKRQ